MKVLLQHALEKTALALLSAFLYVIFFELNSWLFAFFEYGEGISWVFLPAGFRIILVLVLGLPGAAGLALGSWFIDSAMFQDGNTSLAFMNGLAGGITPWLVMKYLQHRQWLSPQLHALTVSKLLNITLVFSAASALTHQLIWWVLDRPELNIWVDFWPMFCGNVLGAMLMLYGFKFLLALNRKMAPQDR
jgi:hypothetical protein